MHPELGPVRALTAVLQLGSHNCSLVTKGAHICLQGNKYGPKSLWLLDRTINESGCADDEGEQSSNYCSTIIYLKIYSRGKFQTQQAISP